MKSLLLLTLLPAVSFAQVIEGHAIKEVKGIYFATPETKEFRLKDNSTHTGEPCETGRTSLKEAVAIYNEYKCDTNKNSSWCKSIIDSVNTFATLEAGNTWGSPKTSFSIDFLEQDNSQVKLAIAQELGVQSDKIVFLYPDLSKVGPEGWDIERSNKEGFYQKIMDTFRVKRDIRMDLKATKFITNNRLQYCAIKEGSVSFVGQYAGATKVSIPASLKETQDLNTIYQGVLKDWDKLEEKKWQNSLHKILYAGSIIKNRLDNQGKELNLEKYFDKFFTVYSEDQETSVHLLRFNNFEEFSAKVNPAHEEKVFSVITLKQQE